MRIYTKTGDKGMTKLVDGAQVAKDSDRVESYGTIDELNSWIGFIISETQDTQIKKELQEIQQMLFDLGTDLATPESTRTEGRLYSGSSCWLEERIDRYTDEAPEIERFILPGGTTTASMLHVARTITRREERAIVTLSWTSSLNSEIVIFINRLSDYFYALARVINAREKQEDVFYERGEKVFHKIKSTGL